MGSMSISFSQDAAFGAAPGWRGEMLNEREQILAQANIRMHEETRVAWESLAKAQRAMEAEIEAVRARYRPKIDYLTRQWESHLDQANEAGWAVVASVHRRTDPDPQSRRRPRR